MSACPDLKLIVFSEPDAEESVIDGVLTHVFGDEIFFQQASCGRLHGAG